MKKIKRLLCSLLLVPCMLVGAACGKEESMSLKDYAKSTKEAGEKFYTSKFYPNSGDYQLSFPAISFELTKEIIDEGYAEVEYNHREEDESILSDREVYVRKSETTIEAKVTLEPVENYNSYMVRIETNEERVINAKRASEDDLSVEDYKTVENEKTVVTYFPAEDGITVYESKEIEKTGEEKVTTKRAHNYGSSLEADEILYEFLEDINEKYVDVFFEEDLELILAVGKFYKDGKTWGVSADYALPQVSENNQGYVAIEYKKEFKNNLPSKYEQEAKFIYGTKGLEGYSKSEVDMELKISYSVNHIGLDGVDSDYEKVAGEINLYIPSLSI